MMILPLNPAHFDTQSVIDVNGESISDTIIYTAAIFDDRHDGLAY